MIDVALVSDAAYLPWCAVLCASIGAAHPAGSVRIHLVHDGSPAGADLEALRGFATDAGLALEVHAASTEQMVGLPPAGGYGAIVWLRLLLPELLNDVDRALYLDVDTFVASNLGPLVAIDLQGLPLAAVQNVSTPTNPSRSQDLGLSAGAPYFNSGVLLMDLDRWRDDRWQSRMLTCARTQGASFTYPDQDALNVVFAGAWLALDPRWNCQNALFFERIHAEATFGVDAVRAAVDDPGILHFEGPPITKPWHIISPHPWTVRYRATLARTPFAGAPLIGSTPLNRAIGALPPRLRFPVLGRLQAARRAITSGGR